MPDAFPPDADASDLQGTDGSEATTPDGQDKDNGLVIPSDGSDEETKPDEPKKDTGCNAAPDASSSIPLVGLLLGLAGWRVASRKRNCGTKRA